MSNIIDRVNSIKARIEEGVNVIMTTPEVSAYYDWNDAVLSKEYTDYQDTLEEARAKVSDAILDYKMAVYQCDPNSPLYEMVRTVSTDVSPSLIRVHQDKDVNKVLYLIDKFIAYYSDSE